MSDRDELSWIKSNEPWRLGKTVKTNIESGEWFLKLININGIGIETARDIGTMFDSLEELKKALLNNKVGLRNDIVKKLKQALKCYQ